MAQFLYDWQTLIAGVLALIAGVGTIWATRWAANSQISAAQKLERRRMAREGHAFATALQAAMTLVVERADKVLPLAQTFGDVGESPQAYEVRQQLEKTGFADLRSTFLRLGGELSEPFFRLEQEIDHFSGRWHIKPGTFSAETIRYGVHTGIVSELRQISAQSAWLRDEAIKDKQRCNELLIQESQ